MKQLRKLAADSSSNTVYHLYKEGYNFYVDDGKLIQQLRETSGDVDGFMGQNYSEAYQLFAYRMQERLGADYAKFVLGLIFDDVDFAEAMKLPVKSSTSSVIESLNSLV